MKQWCLDFVERLGPDLSATVLSLLDDPADLVRASSVCRSWLCFVIANGFCKKLCLRKCLGVSSFTHVTEIKDSKEFVEAGSSTSVEWKSLEREHRIYAHLTHCVETSAVEMVCILEPLGASSTDHFPRERIENTLEPGNQVGFNPSYWSSKGESDPGVPETLTYLLDSPLCVINEIKIQPFKAYFQNGNYIYSAKAVQFKMGYCRTIPEKETDVLGYYMANQGLSDEHYTWMYVSSKFPMVQENVLQSFRLPHPVICIGGIVQIKLLGRVQKHEFDDLYYICISHVEVRGHTLSPAFDFDVHDPTGNIILKYVPEASSGTSPKDGMLADSKAREVSSSSQHVLATGGRQSHHLILHGSLGALAIIDDDSGSEDLDGEPFA